MFYPYSRIHGSGIQLWNIQPSTLARALISQLRKLDTPGTTYYRGTVCLYLRLSPFYDLIAIHAWPSHVFNHHLVLSIGGESNTHKVKRSHWEQLADDCAISFSLFVNSIDILSEGIIDAFERAQKRFEREHGAYPAFQQIRKALLQNQRLLKKAFE